MLAKQIKVGDAYGVVGTTKTRRRGEVVKATVVETGVRYEAARGGGYMSRTMHNGVRVEFDEPMIKDYHGYEPLAGYVERVQKWAADEARANAITSDVLTPMQVIEPWAEREQREARADEMVARALKHEQEAADAFAAGELANVVDLLAAAGLSPRVTPSAVEFSGGSIPLGQTSRTGRPVRFVTYQRSTIDMGTLLLLVEAVAGRRKQEEVV